MNWPVAGLCLIMGGGVGFMLAPKGGASNDASADQKNTDVTTVSSKSFGASSGVVLDRILSGTGVNAGVVAKMKSSSDWVRMIKEQTSMSGGMLEMQKKMLDMGVFMKLVPDEHIEGVVRELGSGEAKGNMMEQMMNQFFVYSLTDRWYSSNPEAMKDWALIGDQDGFSERVQMLLMSALQNNPEDGIALYEEHKDNIQSGGGGMGMFSEMEGLVAQSKLEVEGVDGFWKFYDELPSQKQRNLGYAMQLDLEPAEYAEFYTQSESRMKDNESYEQELSRGQIFSSWGENEPESLAQWYGSNKDGLLKKSKASALLGMMADSDGVGGDVIRAELAANSDLITEFMATSSYFYMDGEVDTVEKKIALLPEGSEITGGMLLQTMSSLQWYNPEKAITTANHITAPQDRYDTLKSIISNPGAEQYSSADLKVIENALSKVDLTDTQRAELLQKASEEPKPENSLHIE